MVRRPARFPSEEPRFASSFALFSLWSRNRARSLLLRVSLSTGPRPGKIRFVFFRDGDKDLSWTHNFFKESEGRLISLFLSRHGFTFLPGAAIIGGAYAEVAESADA
jgi:hypothetical protein